MSSPPTAPPTNADRPRDFYPGWQQWIYAGFQRFPVGAGISLLLGYSGVLYAVWAGILGFFGGIFYFLLLRVFHVPGVGEFLNHTPTSTTILGGILAAFVGAGVAFALFYIDTTLANLGDTITALAIGIVVSVALVAAYGAFEETLIRLQGYRRLSINENKRIAPLAQQAADALHLGSLPRLAMSDRRGRPDATIGTRTLVLSRGLLDLLDDNELRAVIAHELAHWRRADVIGKFFILANGWPLLLWYQIGAYLAVRDPLEGVKAGQMTAAVEAEVGGSKIFGSTVIPLKGIIPAIGRIIALPSALLINFVLIPLVAKETRRSEYAADALVKEGGLGRDLASALRKVEFFESGRIGFSRKLADTHPPTELRIERLEDHTAADAAYLEPELGTQETQLVKRGGGIAVAALLVLALASVYAHTTLPGAASIPLLGSGNAPQAASTGLLGNPSVGNPATLPPTTATSAPPPTPTPTVTPTPVVLTGQAPTMSVGVPPPQYQSGPPTIHFEITLTNQASTAAEQVVIEVINGSGPVAILGVDAASGCGTDTTSQTHVDLPTPLAAQDQALCEPYVSAGALGAARFHVAVFANGNTTQPARTGDFSCVINSFGGEDCNPA